MPETIINTECMVKIKTDTTCFHGIWNLAMNDQNFLDSCPI